MFTPKFSKVRETQTGHYSPSYLIQLKGRYSDSDPFFIGVGTRDDWDIKKITGEDKIVVVCRNRSLDYWGYTEYVLEEREFTADRWIKCDDTEHFEQNRGTPEDLDQVVEIYRARNGYAKTYSEEITEIVDLVIDNYLERAVWASSRTNREGEILGPMDHKYHYDDITKAGRALAREFVYDFIDCAGLDDVLEYIDLKGYGRLGQDIWLTQNGHGVGFWDRGLDDLGHRLTEAAKMIGSAYVYECGNNRHISVELG